MNWEVARFRDPESAADLAKALTESGISATTSSTAPAYDVTTLGGRGSAEVYIVLVQGEDDEVLARESMLDGDRLILSAGVRKDSHLREFGNDDLRDILRHPREWSTYEVATAEALLQQRGENFEPVRYDRLTADSAETLAKHKILSEGQWVLAIIVCLMLWKLAALALNYDLSPYKPRHYPLPHDESRR